MSNASEVVATGLGLITSVGVGLDALKRAALEGRTGVSRITEFNVENHPVKIAAMVRDWDPSSVLDAKQMRLAARIVALGMGAATQAMGPDNSAVGDPTRIGTIVGTAVGGLEVLSEAMETCQTKGPKRVSPFAVPQLMDNATAAWVALRWGLRGPSYAMGTTCATSIDAMGLAFDMIRSGRVDAMLVGGAEGGVTPFTLGSFAAANLLSTQNDHPEHASCPFDKDRDGLVMGEGSGLFLLERRDRAEKRGARILARVCSYAATQDAYHVVSPRPDGSGLASAITIAMEQAGISASDVGYLSAHGMSSIEGDVAESMAIRSVLGKHADDVPVGATKSITGYTLGAAGAISAAAAVLAVNEGTLVPSVTLKNRDPRCNINVLDKAVTNHKVNYAVVNASAFGGHNACLVLGAP